MLYSNYIGVIDSGLGGISVLKILRAVLPHESFIYYADKDNAPYGLKSDEVIYSLINGIVSYFISNGCKAIVIACNTATSVSVRKLREIYSIPIVGLEPALKPAVQSYPFGNVLVLATPVTLSHPKFCDLLSRYDNGRIYTAALPELVGFVECGEGDSELSSEYIAERLSHFIGIKFDACVLGCTHFPFARNAISKALGYVPAYFDGSRGAALYLKKLLEEKGIAAPNTQKGIIMWNRIYPKNLQNKLLFSNI